MNQKDTTTSAVLRSDEIHLYIPKGSQKRLSVLVQATEYWKQGYKVIIHDFGEGVIRTFYSFTQSNQQQS